MQRRPLGPASRYPFTNTAKFLNGDSATGACGHGDDAVADHMVGVPCEAGFLPARHLLPSIEHGDADERGTEAIQTRGIQHHGSSGAEGVAAGFIRFVGLRDDSESADRVLGQQAEALPDLTVDQAVQRELRELLLLPGDLADVVARGMPLPLEVCQRGGLRRSRRSVSAIVRTLIQRVYHKHGRAAIIILHILALRAARPPFLSGLKAGVSWQVFYERTAYT